MESYTVIFDANVLYPATLRSILMYLSTTELFRARWTLEIHEEWIRNLLVKRPDLSRGQLEQQRDLMIQVIPDSLVTGYQPIIQELKLPDASDRHCSRSNYSCKCKNYCKDELKRLPCRRSYTI